MRLAGAADPFQSMANFSGGGGGGGGNTQSTSTSYSTNIPEYAQPYVTSMLNATQQQLFNVKDGQVTGFAPYVPYSADPRDYVAKFSPMQRQSFESAANLQTPGQFAVGSDLATAAGEGALSTTGQALGYGSMGSQFGSRGAELGIAGGQRYGEMGAGYGAQAAGLAPQAQVYGQTAADIGRMGLEAQTYGRDVGEQARQYAAQAAGAGQQYAQMATTPSSVQAYMSPYQQAATDVQKREAQRAFDIQAQARKATAARAGAYGGSRQAIEQAEATRNLNQQLQNIQATGDQAAYDRAIQSMQYGTGLGLQGLQGAQAGLGTALQGGQLGLSGIGQAMAGQQAGLSGLGQAGNLYGIGMQGAQTGLQGIQTQLAGTAQGMQGAQVGLQGVQGAQAGYGLANQAAGTLGQLGSQQLAAQQSIINMQNQLGAQQQARQQQIINQAVQDYANAQQYPLMQLGTMSNMLRGLPLQSATTQQYVAQPNMATQTIGTLGSAGSLYSAMKKKGGIIAAKKMAKGGITSYDVGGSVRAKLYDMTPEQLQEELDSPSAEVRKMARGIMMEKQVQGKAGGGIIAFAGGTPDPEIIPEAPAPQETATDTRYQASQAPVPAPAAAPAPRQAAPSGPVPTTSEGLKGFLAQESQRQFALANRPAAEGLAERRAYVGEDTAGQEYRKKIMEERANAGDEAVRNNWLRAAQFFADWGSRPGNTLAAGMMALKNSIPDVIADQKEQKKYLREIDKTLYELEKAARAERAGDYDAEIKHKEKAAEIGWKGTSELSSIIRSQEQIAGNIKAASISANRETDMKFLYNTKLKELTGGDPSKLTPAIEAQAAQWASNQAKGLDYKRVADVQKEIGDSERSGTISNLEKSRRLALVQAGTPEEKKAVNEDYDRRIADAKQEITNRIMQGGQPPATAQPAPTNAPAPTALPLPTSQDQLKAGQVYNTSRGPAKWDGKQFVAS